MAGESGIPRTEHRSRLTNVSIIHFWRASIASSLVEDGQNSSSTFAGRAAPFLLHAGLLRPTTAAATSRDSPPGPRPSRCSGHPPPQHCQTNSSRTSRCCSSHRCNHSQQTGRVASTQTCCCETRHGFRAACAQRHLGSSAGSNPSTPRSTTPSQRPCQHRGGGACARQQHSAGHAAPLQRLARACGGHQRELVWAVHAV